MLDSHTKESPVVPNNCGEIGEWRDGQGGEVETS